MKRLYEVEKAGVVTPVIAESRQSVFQQGAITEITPDVILHRLGWGNRDRRRACKVLDYLIRHCLRLDQVVIRVNQDRKWDTRLNRKEMAIELLSSTSFKAGVSPARAWWIHYKGEYA